MLTPVGSSPRAWGKQRNLKRNLKILMHGPRFIPARVGETASVLLASTDSSVHPRARGGNVFLSRSQPMDVWWFIPARVGETPDRVLWPFPRSVHPRARGGNLRMLSDRELYEGSSPRTWGKRTPANRTGSQPRIIPAHMGETPTALKYAHPYYGSSPPRARGRNPCSQRVDLQGKKKLCSPGMQQGVVALLLHGGEKRLTSW